MNAIKYINTTPHAIVLNDGTQYEVSDTISRVSATFSPIENGLCTQVFGDLVGLPKPVEGVRYIASAMVASYAKIIGRTDVVAPATGHPECKRDSSGKIVSVPCFIQ